MLDGCLGVCAHSGLLGVFEAATAKGFKGYETWEAAVDAAAGKPKHLWEDWTAASV